MTVISVNELVSTCSKIAQIYDYDWGSDTDIATLVCWLELNKLNGLERLRQLVDQDALKSPHPVTYEQTADALTIDGLGQSAAGYALASLDFVKALASQQHKNGPLPEVTVFNVTDAMFFVAAAASLDFSQTLSMTGTENGQPFIAHIDGDSVSLANPKRTKNFDIKASKLTIMMLPDSEPGAPLTEAIDQSRSFNYRRSWINALADGILVDPVLWQSLIMESKRILVPSSEHSRQFGTGGGDAND